MLGSCCVEFWLILTHRLILSSCSFLESGHGCGGRTTPACGPRNLNFFPMQWSDATPDMTLCLWSAANPPFKWFCLLPYQRLCARIGSYLWQGVHACVCVLEFQDEHFTDIFALSAVFFLCMAMGLFVLQVVAWRLRFTHLAISCCLAVLIASFVCGTSPQVSECWLHVVLWLFFTLLFILLSTWMWCWRAGWI